MTAQLLFAPWESDGLRLWGRAINGDPVYLASLKFKEDSDLRLTDESREFLNNVLSSVPEMYEAILEMKRRIEDLEENQIKCSRGTFCDVSVLIDKAQAKWEGRQHGAT